MRLQKIILCTAIALCAFGASLGLLEIGAYVRAGLQPLKVRFTPPEPVQMPVFYPPLRELPVPAAPREEPAPVEQEPEDYGNTGDYYILDERPKAFVEFENMTITDREWSEKRKKLVSIKPTGSIQTYRSKTGNRDYDYSLIEIKGKRLSLATKTSLGLNYRFEGRFVEETVKFKDENGEEYEKTVYLKGRLSKWRDGKKIAEAKVRFGISHGC